MRKKLIISEEERKNILSQHESRRLQLHEQYDDETGNKIVRCFLEKKGIKETNLSLGIEKYQAILRIFPTNGQWGSDIMDKMPKPDKDIYNGCVQQHQGLMDKFMEYLGF